MEFKTIAVSELEGAGLDWAVGVAQGNPMATPASDVVWSEYHGAYSPSTNWSQGGPLIDEYRMLVCPPEETDQWDASVNGDYEMHYGSTALIALCRAIVAAKLGKEVSIPASLLGAPYATP